jgi:hypothetical protein
MFVIEKDLLIDVVHRKLIRNFSNSSAVEVGRNIEIFGSKCFSWCTTLSSITFESNSLLTRIESEAFYGSSLQLILIPSNVEILGSSCFSNCKSLLSITFESDSHLTRIESGAFYESSLESIVIPRNVQFMNGSAFTDVTLSSISIESGNEFFFIESGLLIDAFHHKLIQNFSESSSIEIGMNVEILGSHCFSYCKSLSSITFESNSHLTRIESFVFSWSSPQSIVIPRNIQFIDGLGHASDVGLRVPAGFFRVSVLLCFHSLGLRGRTREGQGREPVVGYAHPGLGSDLSVGDGE